jgi:putative methyltransferase (TIGR04325 family)
MIKEALRAITPPFLVNLYRKSTQRYGWFGNYPTWQDALKDATGYNSEVIAEKVLASALRVKRGDAAYERDSVLFDKVEHAWPVLAGLLWVSQCNNGTLNVLDVGGGYGSSYVQNRKFLSSLKEMSWNIVEQEKFVKLGKEHFESDQLRFYNDLDECMKQQPVNVALLSCVLPYLERPYEFLGRLFSYRIPTIIFDRMPFMPGAQPHRITLHAVDPAIYAATIPTHIFNESEFLGAMQKEYDLVENFLSDLGFTLADGTPIPNKGFIFQIKS